MEHTQTAKIEDLIGKTITNCFQWTFYRIITDMGIVVIRWYGESNGYYSVDVDFLRVVTS